MSPEQALEHMNEVKSEYINTHQPQSISTYEYWAEIARVVDADTLDLNISVGFNMTVSERVRLIGINTPETHCVKHDSEEYRLGMMATEYLVSRAPIGSWIEVKIFYGKREKYGRWLAEVFVDGESINQELLVSGHAEPIH